jgi:phosphoribosylaminoimidazolecarboxamide formyltransferase/IMP cyclohydrolase
MSEQTRIRSALISVFDKTGLEPLIKKLHDLKVEIFSTGGTLSFIREMGIPVASVESLTGYPEVFGGRVKTLHPAIFGGILNRRSHDKDREEKKIHRIKDLDLVVVDLYPFEKTVAAGASEEDIIEKIDIGGISLLRAAAKNFRDVLVVASQKDYHSLIDVLSKNSGSTTLEERKTFAARSFAMTAHYDAAIFNYFNRDAHLCQLRVSVNEGQILRYGENPHQQATFYGRLEDIFSKLNGKDLSYNNLLDVDAAVNLIAEFTETTFCILKHNNACGVASRPSVLQAYADALAGDPLSAFGGILICNKTIDISAAKEIHKLFFEVIIAPLFDEDALSLLKSKPNRIILRLDKFPETHRSLRTLLNGVISQDKDLKTETAEDLKAVTDASPSAAEVTDLLFANKIAKHTKSNTIVLARNQQLLGSGTGQTSRVDALQQAISKCRTFGFGLKSAVMASDAFFPFPDCVEIAHKAGITAVIQPGGSIKDKDSINYCNKTGMSMVFTGTRHFRH